MSSVGGGDQLQVAFDVGIPQQVLWERQNPPHLRRKGYRTRNFAGILVLKGEGPNGQTVGIEANSHAKKEKVDGY